MIRVIVTGALGRMGAETVRAVTAADGLQVVARVDPGFARDDGATTNTGECGCGCGETEQTATPRDFATLADALAAVTADVLVDFTRPDVVEENLRCAIPAGLDCVVGTTGLADATLDDLAGRLADGQCLFIAPNFAIGAVLMMQFAARAAAVLPKAEIIELHHDRKLDAPSGTALRTASLMTAAGAADPVPIHSVRLQGFVASQEVIFGAQGQTLSIRHDTTDRTSFMPGVVLACRRVVDATGLIVGLEQFLDL
ncbi:MAG: 4-hydroxy-tetrahydrodipicolinate reductase [Actinomycetes bacterium]|jgi:4-hydroxy-tetrahydrodipicolinate reductase|nr:4-hydroxy-tetrahydrodipicolinate reductase [Actinomycetes bacterium]